MNIRETIESDAAAEEVRDDFHTVSLLIVAGICLTFALGIVLLVRVALASRRTPTPSGKQKKDD